MPGVGTAANSVTFTPADGTDYTTATSLVSLVVNPAPVKLLFTGSGPAHFGQPVTLTATVTGAPGTATGTVTFLDGSTALGSVSLSDGSAALTLATLAQGTNSLTASYLGDTDDAPSLSSPVLEIISAPAVAVTVPPAPLAVAAGGSVSAQVTLASLGSLSGPITFQVSGLPAGVRCTFSPASVDVSTGPVQVTVTLSTTQGLQIIGCLKGLAPETTGAGGLLVGCGLLLWPLARRKSWNSAPLNPRGLGYVLSTLAIALVLWQTACTSHNASSGLITGTGTAIGQYEVTVTASAPGATPASFAIPLTVN